MKTILVPVGGSEADAIVLDTALRVAQPLSAHLELVHVRVTAAGAARHTPHVEFARGAGLASALDRLRGRAAQRSAAAERNARAFCSAHGIGMVEAACLAPTPATAVTARWRLDEGEAIERLLFHARHHDLVVMARPTDLDGLPPDRLESLLMGSGRPLLIAPVGAPMPALGTVVVCWKEAPEAARAVSAALPLLSKAGRVVAVGVSEHGEDPAEALGEIIDQLRWHGIAAEAQPLECQGRSTAETLLAAAKTHEADLVVMGAFGHRRMREMLFGGCTQRALEDTQWAVLLAH